MTRALSWFQTNYTPAGRTVRANVLTTYDDGNTIGKDLDVTIEGDVTEASILTAVQVLLDDVTIAPVAAE